MPGKDGLAPEGLLAQPFQQRELGGKSPCARDGPSSAICVPGRGDPKMLCPGEFSSGPTARQGGGGWDHPLNPQESVTFSPGLSHPPSGRLVSLGLGEGSCRERWLEKLEVRSEAEGKSRGWSLLLGSKAIF